MRNSSYIRSSIAVMVTVRLVQKAIWNWENLPPKFFEGLSRACTIFDSLWLRRPRYFECSFRSQFLRDWICQTEHGLERRWLCLLFIWPILSREKSASIVFEWKKATRFEVWFPIRLALLPLVEVAGIEPASFGSLVWLLRVQLPSNFRCQSTGRLSSNT